MLADNFEVVSSGCDWLTVTSKWSHFGSDLERLAETEASKQIHSGATLERKSRLGFEGWSVAHMYFGRREHDAMLQVSGGLADSLAAPAIALASNVSRFDLQVTVYTEGLVLRAAEDAWKALKVLPNGMGRPRSFSLIVGHPDGQTLYVGQRSSDSFGRLYDKGVESKIGVPGLLWRYECEYKRKRAHSEASGWCNSNQPSMWASKRVHSWMTERGVECLFAAASIDADICGEIQDSSRDVLSWFNDSVRVTIGKSIKRYGLVKTLEALGLEWLLGQQRVNTHGNLRAQTTSGASHTSPTTTQPNHSERILL